MELDSRYRRTRCRALGVIALALLILPLGGCEALLYYFAMTTAPKKNFPYGIDGVESVADLDAWIMQQEGASQIERGIDAASHWVKLYPEDRVALSDLFLKIDLKLREGWPGVRQKPGPALTDAQEPSAVYLNAQVYTRVADAIAYGKLTNAEEILFREAFILMEPSPDDAFRHPAWRQACLEAAVDPSTSTPIAQ